MDDLLQEFIGETREMLAAITGEIVEWEADPMDRARLDAIFRFVHTVKGSCGFLDLPRLARLSHAAEDVLGDLRAGRRAPDTRLVNAVLRIVDRIGELAEAIETGVSLPDGDDHGLIAALGSAPAAEEDMAPAAPLPVASRDQAPRAVSRAVRLPIELLDRMMGGVSDMVLARNELARKLREAGGGIAVDLAFERLSASIGDMREAITRTRMQRIDNVFAILPRLVRDLSAELGKLVTIEIEGGDVELDREMIEMIRDPLTHIMRNALDHGVETPDERRAAGKPPVGRLIVTARQSGNQILIEICDDGRGIDGDRVADKAIAAGILTPEQASRLTWAQKVELVFEAGLSTADVVTTISGRGVGMDVVRANVERIGGLVELESRPHAGLRVVMRVPLTLTIIPALTVTAGPYRFAIPRAVIEEIARTRGEHVRLERVGNAEMATIRGKRLPVVRLGDLLGQEQGDDGAAAILVTLRPAGGAVYALAVDAVHDHEELVIKPAAPGIMVAGIYAGTTLPDDGQPMLLLDPAGIAIMARVPLAQPEPQIAPAAAAQTEPSLVFTDLDGAERAIRLAVVERIDDVAADAIAFSGGRLRLVQEGHIVPLLTCVETVTPGRMNVLRLSDGTSQIGYAIAGVIDIRELPVAMAPAATPGIVAGVVLADGRQIELLDPYWLFGEGARGAGTIGRPPLVLLGDAADPWTRDMLRPLVAAAGYRVAFAGDELDDLPDIVIESGMPIAPGTVGDAPLIRLRADPTGQDNGETIWRYDRAGVIAALRAHAGGGHG